MNSMENCLFCKFAKEHPAKVYEDELFYIIKDIEPKAPLHYLAIPKRHYKYITEMANEDIQNLGKIVNKVGEISINTLHLDGGYRLVINQGDNAGQTVPHLHIHILGGKKMDWNPA